MLHQVSTKFQLGSLLAFDSFVGAELGDPFAQVDVQEKPRVCSLKRNAHISEVLHGSLPGLVERSHQVSLVVLEEGIVAEKLGK